jgi:hypothetical protein
MIVAACLLRPPRPSKRPEIEPRVDIGLLLVMGDVTVGTIVTFLPSIALAVFAPNGRFAPGGLMAFQISARFVDLRPVFRELAPDAGLACRVGIGESRRPRSGRTTSPILLRSCGWEGEGSAEDAPFHRASSLRIVHLGGIHARPPARFAQSAGLPRQLVLVPRLTQSRAPSHRA